MPSLEKKKFSGTHCSTLTDFYCFVLIRTLGQNCRKLLTSSTGLLKKICTSIHFCVNFLELMKSTPNIDSASNGLKIPLLLAYAIFRSFQ